MPLLSLLQQQHYFVVAADVSASHTCEDCWPWWLGLAAAMINASTRQEASTSICQTNIYLLTHIIPVSGHTLWWTNLSHCSHLAIPLAQILCLSTLHNAALKEQKPWKTGSFRFPHFFFFLLWMIKHAAVGSCVRCTCWLPFDKAVTCTKKRLCVFWLWS